MSLRPVLTASLPSQTKEDTTGMEDKQGAENKDAEDEDENEEDEDEDEHEDSDEQDKSIDANKDMALILDEDSNNEEGMVGSSVEAPAEVAESNVHDDSSMSLISEQSAVTAEGPNP